MLKKIIKNIYYFIYSLFISRFLVINFFKNLIILDKKKLKILKQIVRNDYDLNTFRQIFVKEEYSFNKPIDKVLDDYYSKIVSNNKIPLIIDCGSNIGASSNYFNIIFPKSKIIAIEPDLENNKLFKKNICSNNIILFENAISSEKFYYDIIRSQNNDWRSSSIKKIISNENEISQKNTSITINEIFNKFKAERYSPLLIKIDIEGHEKELFEKNTEWAKDFKVIVIELHDWLKPNEAISSNFSKSISVFNNETFTFGENTVVINKSK